MFGTSVVAVYGTVPGPHVPFMLHVTLCVSRSFPRFPHLICEEISKRTRLAASRSCSSSMSTPSHLSLRHSALGVHLQNVGKIPRSRPMELGPDRDRFGGTERESATFLCVAPLPHHLGGVTQPVVGVAPAEAVIPRPPLQQNTEPPHIMYCG